MRWIVLKAAKAVAILPALALALAVVLVLALQRAPTRVTTIAMVVLVAAMALVQEVVLIHA